MTHTKPLVIGVGNPDRADDAAGWKVVELLVDDAPVMLSSGDPASLMALWEGRAWVIIVDAVTTGAEPGTLLVRELLDEPVIHDTLYSSHGLGPLEAIEIGRALGIIPDRVTLVGIEAGTFDLTAGMSAAVDGALGNAAETVRTLLITARSGAIEDR